MSMMSALFKCTWWDAWLIIGQLDLTSSLHTPMFTMTLTYKNSTMFGYLSMLVNQGMFGKVKVHFLLVGHTHDHIDHMFSTFSR